MPASKPRKSSRLARLIRRLRTHYGRPAAPPFSDPYRLLLWEQVAYLGCDGDRRAAFRLLETSVGTDSTAILAASDAAVRAVTRRGGAIAFVERAERLRAVANRVFSAWNGDLNQVLALSFVAARKELTKYPSIGEAGAERILLLSRAHPVLALESNSLRVLQRLGYSGEGKRWAASYREAQGAAEKELARTVGARRAAYLLLKQHGETLCRRSAPRCSECPL